MKVSVIRRDGFENYADPVDYFSTVNCFSSRLFEYLPAYHTYIFCCF